MLFRSDKGNKVTATGIGFGETTLLVTCLNEARKYEITVPRPSVVDLPPDFTMWEGQTSNLRASIANGEEDATILWNSNDPSTVSVDNGKVTAHKEGEAVITASYSKDPSIQAACTVKVGPSPYTGSLKVVLNPATINFPIGSKGRSITASVYRTASSSGDEEIITDAKDRKSVV